MPGARFDEGGLRGFIDWAEAYKPGDPEPVGAGYTDWHEWAETQYKAGLRQERCGRCCKLKCPQDMSATVDEHRASRTRRGPRDVCVRSPVCKACETETDGG